MTTTLVQNGTVQAVELTGLSLLTSVGGRLRASEIEAIAAYIRAWEPTAPAVATMQRGTDPPRLRNQP